MRRSLSTFIALSFLPLGGCLASIYDATLRTRAAFEMNCPRESLATEDLGQWRVVGVRGCGKRAVYVLVGDQWLLNSEGQQAVVQAAVNEKQEKEDEERRDAEEAERERAREKQDL
jgi:hypothetical protein